ncbi:MAG TPA: xanthine dehydrogenase family protein molybdopterin-binding subunit [Ktedonobacterales bacterium]
MPEYTYLGHSVRRVDGPEKLTGQTRYTADLPLDGLLYARPILSPYAHARIRSVDKSAALALPGVFAVLTADDLPMTRSREDESSRHRSPLAHDYVLFRGQPVAMALASDPAVAQDAADLVAIDYEPLAAVSDPLVAMLPGAPPVHPHLSHEAADAEAGMHAAVAQSEDADAEKEDLSVNVASHPRFKRGDVEEGFREADVVLEETYRTSMVHQTYIEPQAVAAAIDPLGQVTVWASTQAMFYARSEVAAALKLPEHQIRVVAMPVGGGFGGKFILLEPLVAALAVAVRKPVLLSFTRSDDFLAGNPAPQSIITIKAGAKRDGTLTALQARLVFDAGAYPGAPAGIAAIMVGGYYRCPNLDLRGYEVLTHKPGSGAYRAPGAPQATFAIESHMDALAHALGLDPLEFRLHNAIVEGDKRPDGPAFPAIGLRQCLEKVAEHPLWKNRRANETDALGRKIGVGVAVGGWPGGLEPASAACRMDGDGTLTLVVGSVDLTGSDTTLKLIAAEILNQSPESIRLVHADTDASPFMGATGGSKVTYTLGAAVKQAAEDARRQILDIAADRLEAATGDLELLPGRVQVRGAAARGIDLSDIATQTMSFGARYEPVFGRGSVAITGGAPMFTAHVARVAVDSETGQASVLEYAAAQDVGFAINPAEVEGQMMGGIVQGLGWALYEQMLYDQQGQLLNSSFMEYAIPGARVAPKIDTMLVEVASSNGPFGAKGVGEPPVIPGAAVIANAIANATGARVTQIPMTPERVFQALHNGSGNTSGNI